MNGIYILKCKDQFRVAYIEAIENLWWDGYEYKDYLMPAQLFKYFGKCKYTRNAAIAIKIAKRMFEKIYVCEYGIRIIPCDMTWNQIIRSSI